MPMTLLLVSTWGLEEAGMLVLGHPEKRDRDFWSECLRCDSSRFILKKSFCFVLKQTQDNNNHHNGKMIPAKGGVPSASLSLASFHMLPGIKLPGRQNRQAHMIKMFKMFLHIFCSSVLVVGILVSSHLQSLWFFSQTIAPRSTNDFVWKMGKI